MLAPGIRLSLTVVQPDGQRQPRRSQPSDRRSGQLRVGVPAALVLKRGVAAGRSAQRACERSSDWRRGAAGSPDPYKCKARNFVGSPDPYP